MYHYSHFINLFVTTNDRTIEISVFIHIIDNRRDKGNITSSMCHPKKSTMINSDCAVMINDHAKAIIQ